jgi:hypothetical protein
VPPRTVDVRGDGWRLTGRLDHLTDAGLLRFRCAPLRPADRLRAWIEHLALAATAGVDPATVDSRLVAEDVSVRLAVPADPVAVLDALVDGWVQGTRRPLPVFEAATWAWASHSASLRDPRSKSRRTPRDVADDVFHGRDRPARAPAGAAAGAAGPAPAAADPFVRLAFRGLGSGEASSALDHPEAGRWAERLWWPVFEHSREETS